ncbi:tetratricopeptide repeat protein 14 homolog isoform X3 [Nilaparvata lugens]|uniref:tetratricopeptide repeat protein 14 homolog isoform X3 n=2 Tax=Nilaparvata lugens TaxID=108931 RepID=UPI00193CCDC0|nr:tetratricopeptide repeat protein 14 homolog isoform X3 [Nilaparvata lugens]
MLGLTSAIVENCSSEDDDVMERESGNLDLELVARAMSFHGQPFQKVWETERGETDLQKLDTDTIDFSVYSQRHLNFQDRGKRLKLHQFIANKADILFDPALNEREERPAVRVSEPGLYAILPPYDTFLNLDKATRIKHFFQCVKPGDVLIGTIASKPLSGLVVKVLCLEGEAFRYVADLNIRAMCPSHSTIAAVDKKNVSRSFLMNDLVCCEVIEVHEESEKLICGMKGVHASEHRARLGLFSPEDFPEAYKQAQEGNNGETYSEMLEKAVGFNNPNNINCLSNTLGLGMNNFSCMSALREKFPESEFASELRQVQASRWAHRNVADGIEHFKAKRHSDAFQCLNQALRMDPRNIEGLVARGALHANSCSFKKAIEDFETALKLNPSHQNARKYLGETLVAYGRSFEEENKMDEAIKAYESCLAILPYHEEAQNSIDYIKNKTTNGTSKVAGAGEVGGLSLNKAQGVKDTLKQLLGDAKDDGHSSATTATTSAKKKKKDKKRRRHRRSSSTSSSSSSASSSSSSSSSSSDSSSASSQDSHHKKKHKRKDKDRDRDRSLSPLSKRMAMMDSSMDNEGLSGSALRVSHYNPPSMPNSFTSMQAAQPVMEGSEKSDEYEHRVRKFLAQTKGADSDYEEKIRKFLDETAKWKKEKKAIEEKSKKKKKKEKKAKNKSKKKKREEKRKKKAMKELEEKKLREALKREKRRRSSASFRAGDEEEDEDDGFVFGDKPDQALRMLSMGNIRELEDLKSQLSAYYAKVEKESPPSTLKKKDHSSEKGFGSSKIKMSPKMYEDEDESKEVDSSPPPPPLPSRNLTSSLLVKKRLELLSAESPLSHIAAAASAAAAKDDSPAQRLADIMPPKFKMQIGNAGNRLKGLKKDDQSVSRDVWEDDRERSDRDRDLTRFVFVKDDGGSEEGEAKKSPDMKGKNDETGSGGAAGNDSFRMSRSPDVKPQLKRKLRTRTSDSESSDSGGDRRAKKNGDRSNDESSRSRSRSRSHKKYSSESPKKYSSESRSSSYHRKERSRSKSGSYRSRSRRYRSSESGSYRSRSYSRSRSRSRSGDYRRSRSRSDDRHHYRKYVGRYPRTRGTYYRPRFQNYKNPRGGGGYGGGQRGHRNRGYGNRGGNRGYIPRMRGRGRPRFFHHKYGDRRDYRRYDRGGSRSDEDDLSPMRKVESAKERIDKMIGDQAEKRHSGPLSEGEERDDDYIDRKDYDGKWGKEPEGPRLPPHDQ